MTTKHLIFRNTYRDSVVLMRLSRELESMDGVQQATVVMGTENNVGLLESAGLTVASLGDVSPNDLIVSLCVSSPEQEDEITARARKILESEYAGRGGQTEHRPHTLDGALGILPDANLALISVPGLYAAYEAGKAIDRGLNVLLFSDNVSIEEEVELKHRALEMGVFMLGPDCGTAVINDVPLGFANVVPPGRVGLVSASGTGLQQVMCLLAAGGEGVSQALGVGSRDLDDRVGGAMMLEGLRALEADPRTELIVLISKPPGPATRGRVLTAARQGSKPCVICFLGAVDDVGDSPNTFVESNLEGTALRVLSLPGVEPSARRQAVPPPPWDRIEAINARLSSGWRGIRGLYSGGTLCYEGLLLLRDLLSEPLYANLELPGVRPLDGGQAERGHQLVDLGDDRFTVGRPHPMIDYRQRSEQLVREAAKPDVGILLLDVMLGHGAHPDPASELAPALKEAQEVASREGRGLACVVVLSGTAGDPQFLDVQQAQLTSTGAVVVSSNVQAVRIAAALSRGDLGLVGGYGEG